MNTRNSRSLLVGCAATIALTGCQSPFGPMSTSDELREDVLATIERELKDFPAQSRELETDVDPSATEAALAERRAELDELSPALGERERSFELGEDLAGQSQDELGLSLEEAIDSAVRNNLAVQVARLQPAITLQDVITAEAAFDAVFFAGAEFTRIDEQTDVPVINGTPIGSAQQTSNAWRFETGVRSELLTGGNAFLSTDMTRTDFRSPGVSFSPDPAYNAAIRLGIVQPLLRNFGTDIAQSTIMLTRNLQRQAVQDLRVQMLELVAETETAYWDLVFAWQDIEIRQWLVDEGIEVRDVLERRRDFDARPAEYADAVARVEQRQADVIRARRQLRAASDNLKLLINDPQLAVGSEAVIYPIDAATASPISYDVTDMMRTAIAHRPEIEQARLRIDDTRIQERLAANALLPQLDLAAQVDFTGLESSMPDAYGEIGEGFVNYLFGLTFEAPIGNRAAEAGFRQARLQRSASLLEYRRTLQQVILDVKDALRDVVTNYELIQATRSFRVAQAENLRALMVREALVGLTPEFLNLMFQRQETLATARQQEILAQVSFDQSVARLYRAMGTGLQMHGIDFETLNAEDR